MSATYTERDARDWQRALDEKDAEISRLRAALKPFAEFGRTVPGEHIDVTYAQRGSVKVTNHDFRAALKALE